MITASPARQRGKGRRTLEVDEQLRALEVPRRDPDVVLGPRVVELCETPVDQAELRAREARVSWRGLEGGTRRVLRPAPRHGRQGTRQTHLALLVVDHDIVGLDVAVHDAARVAKVEGLEELKDVVPHVKVGQARVQDLEVRVVDVLEHERGCFALRGGRGERIDGGQFSRRGAERTGQSDRADGPAGPARRRGG